MINKCNNSWLTERLNSRPMLHIIQHSKIMEIMQHYSIKESNTATGYQLWCMSIANLLALSIMHRNAMMVNSYHFVTQIYHYRMELVRSYFLQYSSPSKGTSVSSLCGRSMGMYKTVIRQLFSTLKFSVFANNLFWSSCRYITVFEVIYNFWKVPNLNFIRLNLDSSAIWPLQSQ